MIRAKSARSPVVRKKKMIAKPIPECGLDQIRYLERSLSGRGARPDLFLKVAGKVAKARGLTQFARETGLNRENLYRIFSGHQDVHVQSLNKILEALGFELAVTRKGSTRAVSGGGAGAPPGRSVTTKGGVTMNKSQLASPTRRFSK